MIIDKRKLSTVLAVIVAALVMALLLGGCSSASDEPSTEEPAVEEVAPNEGETAPAATVRQSQPPSFSTKEGTLVSAAGSAKTLTFPGINDVSESHVLGACCEDLAFTEYTTATYNEQWKSYDDEVTHYGYVSGDGALAFSLDPIADKYNASSIRGGVFNEGRAVLVVTNKSDNIDYVIIDNTGKEIFTTGNSQASGYQGGVLVVNDSAFYDSDGKLLYKDDSAHAGYPVNAGLGYVMYAAYSGGKGDPDTSLVYDYQGNVVFDLSSIAADDAEEITGQPTGNVGIIEVLQKRNNTTLYGLYSIPLGKWLIEPDTTSFSAEYADELTIGVTYGNEDGFGFLDIDGNWVMGIDEIPTTRSGYKCLGTKFCSLGNGWFVTKTEWSNTGHSKSINTWGLSHADAGSYSDEDCDALVDSDLDIIFPTNMS